MVVEKDIVAISIPFSAGVVTAALVPPGGDMPYALAAGACLAAAGLLWVFTGRGELPIAGATISIVRRDAGGQMDLLSVQISDPSGDASPVVIQTPHLDLSQSPGTASPFAVVDVWVDRLMRDWFGLTCGSRAALAREARERLGAHAGLMQQFLFHAARTGTMALECVPGTPEGHARTS